MSILQKRNNGTRRVYSRPAAPGARAGRRGKPRRKQGPPHPAQPGPPLRGTHLAGPGVHSFIGPAPLHERVEAATIDERQRAVRALLRYPLLTAAGPHAAEFLLVRRHADWLRRWFARHPAWTVQVDAEFARLRKTPATLSDPTRPARDVKTGLPFSRRRYVLFCLFLAALERSERQNTLGNLANRVLELVHGDPALAEAGIRFDLTSRDERRDLVQVARLLLDLQVLRRVHGDEGQFLAERGDVLYTIHRPLLSTLLNVRRGPSTVDAEAFDERPSPRKLCPKRRRAAIAACGPASCEACSTNRSSTTKN